jgi:hypothetical protein
LSEQKDIDDFEKEERRIISEESSQISSGLAFAIPGRWTGGKREEDEMRRLMAKETEDAIARGEIIEETSASDWSSADDDNPGENQAEEPPKVQDDEVQHQDVENTEEEEPKGQSNAKKRVGDDTGHEADMDDTSMSSRASSRMLESINVMSMDSMNVMYDSEYDDLRLASASAGGPILSDFESDLPPEDDLNNVLDNLDNTEVPLELVNKLVVVVEKSKSDNDLLQPSCSQETTNNVEEVENDDVDIGDVDDDEEAIISTLVEETHETSSNAAASNNVDAIKVENTDDN